MQIRDWIIGILVMLFVALLWFSMYTHDLASRQYNEIKAKVEQVEQESNKLKYAFENRRDSMVINVNYQVINKANSTRK